MKKLIAGVIMLFAGIAPTFAQNIKTQLLDIKPVNAIEVSSGIEVYIRKGPTDKLKIESNIDKLGNLSITQKGKTLIIGYQSGFNRGLSKKDLKTKIYFSTEEICSISAASAASVDCQGDFRTNIFRASASSSADIEVLSIAANTIKVDASSAAEIKLHADAQDIKTSASSASEIELKGKCSSLDCSASSASDIELDLIADNITIVASSSSDVKAAGECKVLQIKASSGSDVKTARLISEEASVKASSGSDVTVHTRKAVDAHASSGADIRCSGNPASRNCNTSSGGSVKIEK